MTNPETKLGKLLTTGELAELLKYKPNTIAKWRVTKQEAIPYTKMGSRVLYSEEDVIAWFEKKKKRH